MPITVRNASFQLPAACGRVGIAATAAASVLVLSWLILSVVASRGPGAGSQAVAAVEGRLLFGHGGDIWSAEGGSLQAVTQGGRRWGQPDWSPDQSSIAMIGWGQGATEIFVLPTDGSDLRQLTRSQKPLLRDNDWVFHPRWSPDGQTIAFVADRNSPYPMLWVMRADGTGARQLTRAVTAQDAVDSLAWAPDGTRLAVTRYSSGPSEVQIVSLAGGQPERVSHESSGAFDPAWSPDGRYLAYVARDGRRSALRVVDLEHPGPSTTLIIGDGLRHPRWSPGGDALAYLALSGSNFEVFVLDVQHDGEDQLHPGASAQLTRSFGVDATAGLAWGP